MAAPTITGIGEVVGAARDADTSLEVMIFESASQALADGGLERADLDGVVLAASDLVDGRAISSMLTSGPAGAYLNEEINLASSPGHALAMAYLQILSGTHERLLVSSWGKASESRGFLTARAERLSAEPFFDRDAGLGPVAAAALQGQAYRAQRADADRAAACVASRNHGMAKDGTPRYSTEDVLASELVAWPLRRLEIPEETDGAFSLLLERDDRRSERGVALAGVGWCSESGRISDRELQGLPHLELAARDALKRAGVTVGDIGAWELHDYTPDAELLAYGALGVCDPADAVAFALDGGPERAGVNRGGGSAAGEAPFGGPLRKVLNAVRTVRESAGTERVLAQITSGMAGQFQSAFVVAAGTRG